MSKVMFIVVIAIVWSIGIIYCSIYWHLKYRKSLLAKEQGVNKPITDKEFKKMGMYEATYICLVPEDLVFFVFDKSWQCSKVISSSIEYKGIVRVTIEDHCEFNNNGMVLTGLKGTKCWMRRYPTKRCLENIRNGF